MEKHTAFVTITVSVQLVAKVTAFPAMTVSLTSTSGAVSGAGSSYTAYSSSTNTGSSNNGCGAGQVPKVPGSPGCISPDSTTMVGPNGFEASLYDEFMSSKRYTSGMSAVSSQQQYLLPQQPQPAPRSSYGAPKTAQSVTNDYSRYSRSITDEAQGHPFSINQIKCVYLLNTQLLLYTSSFAF